MKNFPEVTAETPFGEVLDKAFANGPEGVVQIPLPCGCRRYVVLATAADAGDSTYCINRPAEGQA